jgi:hypothetical protein
MQKRIVPGLALVLYVAILTSVAIWRCPSPPAPGVTLDNFRRLHKGLTLTEMAAILGGPGEPFHYRLRDAIVYEGDGCRVMLWYFREDDVYDGHFLVDGEEVAHLREKPVTFSDWVRALLHPPGR